MSNVTRTLAVVLALLGPLSASAHGQPILSRSVIITYYPVVTTVAYLPCPIVLAPPVLLCPPPTAAAPVYATPTPAPPSTTPPPTTPPTTPPPPLVPNPGLSQPSSASPNPMPKVIESRSHYYDTYPLRPGTADKPTSEHCTVAFWNLTGRRVTLKAGGQSQVLASGQCLTRDLPRDFVWQVEGRDPQRQPVPAGDTGVEIVIRQ